LKEEQGYATKVQVVVKESAEEKAAMAAKAAKQAKQDQLDL